MIELQIKQQAQQTKDFEALIKAAKDMIETEVGTRAEEREEIASFMTGLQQVAELKQASAQPAEGTTQ